MIPVDTFAVDWLYAGDEIESLDPLFDALGLAEDRARELVDDALPVEHDDEEEPVVTFDVVDRDGARITAVRLERDGETHHFRIVLTADPLEGGR